MKLRAVSGNPYKDSLLRVAWENGRRAKSRREVATLPRGMSVRVWFAYYAGFRRRGWHRSQNGQLKWHRVGA